MDDYLIYDPDANEVHLRSMRPEQLPFNTEGGTWPAVKLDGKYRTISFVDGVPVETFDLDAVRNPVLRLVEARADALIAPLLATGVRAAVYDAKVTEAGNLDAPTPLLDAEAQAMGVTTPELAEQVLANVAESFTDREAIGAIEAERRTAKASIIVAAGLPEIMLAARAAGVA
ncbi:hypothetical protein [Sphingomonas sp. SRS2]|uniref:hypothetical protein n=1 Tax=Sphingomonas sp. SRS2 TaxID=133190 RepID=UPI0006184F92|nr:hypothetical protein [Sphingomonas sp. SRS2]KKC24938.1 hypothetical protein WP12_17115 [Sphingomonas sp. SRS2]